ncbi:Zn-binding domain-containing protein, partial [Thermodesulfobacteriota bacterium]
MILELLEKSLEHIRDCECDEGCPSCIHSPKCGSGNKPLDKKAAIMILEFLVGRKPLGLFCGDGEQEPAPAKAEEKE